MLEAKFLTLGLKSREGVPIITNRIVCFEQMHVLFRDGLFAGLLDSSRWARQIGENLPDKHAKHFEFRALFWWNS